MKFHVMTLFPEMIEQGASHSILGRAQAENRIQVDTINIRDFAHNKHQHVDDTPYGGGAGMAWIVQMFNKLRSRIHLKPVQILVGGFALVILAGSILLNLPIASRSGESVG